MTACFGIPDTDLEGVAAGSDLRRKLDPTCLFERLSRFPGPCGVRGGAEYVVVRARRFRPLEATDHRIVTPHRTRCPPVVGDVERTRPGRSPVVTEELELVSKPPLYQRPRGEAIGQTRGHFASTRRIAR